MKRVLVLLLLVVAAWQGWTHYPSHRAVRDASQDTARLVSDERPVVAPKDDNPSASFKCDGRKYCSQMTSCAEATYFLKNCPGVKMDGNNDGIPCEKQWCSR